MVPIGIRPQGFSPSRRLSAAPVRGCCTPAGQASHRFWLGGPLSRTASMKFPRECGAHVEAGCPTVTNASLSSIPDPLSETRPTDAVCRASPTSQSAVPVNPTRFHPDVRKHPDSMGPMDLTSLFPMCLHPSKSFRLRSPLRITHLRRDAALRAPAPSTFRTFASSPKTLDFRTSLCDLRTSEPPACGTLPRRHRRPRGVAPREPVEPGGRVAATVPEPCTSLGFWLPFEVCPHAARRSEEGRETAATCTAARP